MSKVPPTPPTSNSDGGLDLTWNPQTAALMLGVALLQFRRGRADQAAAEDLDRAEGLIEMVSEWLRGLP